ncbi:radical SAM protein [bacterium]|nr:radical SAM protein [bacterium]
MIQKSPDFVRTSTAAAITLKLQPGRFYRNAKLGCINILLEYSEGCQANCSYCGLSTSREEKNSNKSFIRVAWPVYSLDLIIRQSEKHKNHLGRICLSMVTHKAAMKDTITITKRLHNSVDLPISILICPTITNIDSLQQLYDAGADRIGIAIDTATEALFRRHRGEFVGGPHQWKQYWKCFDDAVKIFGKNMVGSHLMAGLGETEKELVEAIQRTRNSCGFTHLFSFFPEKGSLLAECEPPPLDSYRRIQLARYLIDNGYMDSRKFDFDISGQITSFNIADEDITGIIKTGEPFQTSGCPGNDNRVACNRPFGNSIPGPDVRNLPYQANPEDIDRIMKCLGLDD